MAENRIADNSQFFVTGPATWGETNFSFQIPREGTWGHLGSGTHLGQSAWVRASWSLGPGWACRVDMAAGGALV